jgi:hypothetical protein
MVLRNFSDSLARVAACNSGHILIVACACSHHLANIRKRYTERGAVTIDVINTRPHDAKCTRHHAILLVSCTTIYTEVEHKHHLEDSWNTVHLR